MPEEAVPSPCVQICTLDAAGTLCLGCGRTLSEIGEWAAATPARQHAIFAEAARRLASRQREA